MGNLGKPWKMENTWIWDGMAYPRKSKIPFFNHKIDLKMGYSILKLEIMIKKMDFRFSWISHSISNPFIFHFPGFFQIPH